MEDSVLNFILKNLTSLSILTDFHYIFKNCTLLFYFHTASFYCIFSVEFPMILQTKLAQAILQVYRIEVIRELYLPHLEKALLQNT